MCFYTTNGRVKGIQVEIYDHMHIRTGTGTRYLDTFRRTAHRCTARQTCNPDKLAPQSSHKVHWNGAERARAVHQRDNPPHTHTAQRRPLEATRAAATAPLVVDLVADRVVGVVLVGELRLLEASAGAPKLLLDVVLLRRLHGVHARKTRCNLQHVDLASPLLRG